MAAPSIPLAGIADRWLSALARTTGSTAIAALDGVTLLGERAMLGAFAIPGRVSAGGGCRLIEARDGMIALNLARPSDRDLLPALFGVDALDGWDDRAIAAQVAAHPALELVARGREMGLAVAAEREAAAPPMHIRIASGRPSPAPAPRSPRVLDLSALWAGPLAGHLLWLAGAEVVKIESRARPDAMRDGDGGFYALLNQGKASGVLDFGKNEDRRALIALIARADIVIEAARPRALAQLGVDAGEMVRNVPGLVWITITGHGASGDAANWVGFGDDCGIAAGLGTALRRATGRSGFVGDAIADPLTGIHAAQSAWDIWTTGRGGRVAIAMSGVAAAALAEAHTDDPLALNDSLIGWRAAEGQRFPLVRRRHADRLRDRGADTARILDGLPSC